MVIYDSWSYMTAASQPARVSRAFAPIAGGRRERHKADIRDRLFRAALELFATRGFVSTTVEDITRAADVAKGTFFNYFPTKEHLLSTFSELRLDIIRAARAAAQKGSLPLHRVLHALFLDLMKEPGRSRAMARCMLLGALGNEPVAAIVERKLAVGRGVLAEIMAIGQRRGEIRRDWAPADLARLFQQSSFGAMYLWVLHPNLNLGRSLDATFALFWAAVENKVRPAHSHKRAS
jgi:AcrR family transcriptional regulator